MSRLAKIVEKVSEIPENRPKYANINGAYFTKNYMRRNVKTDAICIKIKNKYTLEYLSTAWFYVVLTKTLHIL